MLSLFNNFKLDLVEFIDHKNTRSCLKHMTFLPTICKYAIIKILFSETFQHAVILLPIQRKRATLKHVTYVYTFCRTSPSYHLKQTITDTRPRNQENENMKNKAQKIEKERRKK